MTQPGVTLNELDGALGVLPPSAGKLLALVGVSSQGPTNTPATFARVRDLRTSFGDGPLIEAAAHSIENYGKPVLVTRAAAGGVAGTVSTIQKTALGTSTVTVDVSSAPIDDYEPLMVVVKGGTVGTDGITVKLSLDAGRTFGQPVALGTANNVSFPDGAGIKFAFAAGTLLSGDRFSAVATPTSWDTTTLLPALTALRNSAVAWELAHIVGPVDAASIDLLNAWVIGMAAAGKDHAWIANTRIDGVSETAAAYQTAMQTAFGQKASSWGALCSGGTKFPSSVSGRQYRRPVSYVYAAREASLSEEQDSADVNLGALPCSIADINGNPDEHDETVNPGLDDLRFVTLRTWEDGEGALGQPGVYVNRPRLFSAGGSDFDILPKRRVMNIGRSVLRAYFRRRLNKPVLVSRKTGFILESEAVEIEKGATALLRATLCQKPKASDAFFVLSRTDNLLSTKTLTGEGRILPLAYPEWANFDIGYFNPALTLVAA